ncbi:hypothetical protein BH11CYA1_BH11CYA1_30520 [soil metagenome]
MFKKFVFLLPLLLSVSASFYFAIIPAFAADFEQGCQFYNSKNYIEARSMFEKSVKVFPNNWLVHYYLANTYLMTKQSASAAKEYQTCLNCKPNGTTAKYCQDAVLKLTGATATGVADSAAAGLLDKNTPVSAEGAPGKADKGDVKDAASQAIIDADRARAEAILKRANEECKAIREEAKQKVENGTLTGNKWHRRADGTRFIDLMDYEKDAIRKEAEDRCDEIMRTAESSAARLQH